MTNHKRYPVCMEVAGHTAIWTRPDSGDCPCSYPAPTYSAVRGMFESVLWGPAVLVIPTKVELCAPIQYHSYATNYGGPLRSGDVRQGRQQLPALCNGADGRLLPSVRGRDTEP